MSDEIKPPKPSEMLELALKGSAAVLGGLYATGLIVASLRLAQLGVFSTEFVKPLYVLTGAWAWLPIAIAAATWLSYRETLKYSHGRVRVRAFLIAMFVGASLVLFGCFVLPIVANAFLHLMGFGEDFAAAFLFLMPIPFVLGFSIKLLIKLLMGSEYHAKTKIASALGTALIPLWFGTLCFYLMFFTFGVYEKIPVQLGGGAPRTFALVITEPKIRQAITGDVEAKSPIITPVFAETAGNYVLPAPQVRLEELSLSPALSRAGDWGAAKVFEHSFVIVPKQAVSVATVIGSTAEPKDYKRTKQEIENPAGDRDKMNSLGSPSVTPKR